jgi:hypothetical protein
MNYDIWEEMNLNFLNGDETRSGAAAIFVSVGKSHYHSALR